jgi:hypothetical protein
MAKASSPAIRRLVIKHQRRLGLADDRRQRDGQSESRMKAEPCEVGGKPRFGARHPKIGHHRQAQPAADGGAVNGSDDRLLGTEQPVAFDIKMRCAWGRSAQQRAAVAVIVAEIGAGAEGLALRSQHQSAATGVRIKRLISTKATWPAPCRQFLSLHAVAAKRGDGLRLRVSLDRLGRPPGRAS